MKLFVLKLTFLWKLSPISCKESGFSVPLTTPWIIILWSEFVSSKEQRPMILCTFPAHQNLTHTKNFMNCMVIFKTNICYFRCFCSHGCKPCLNHINLHTDTDMVVPFLPTPLWLSSHVLHHYSWWANSTSYAAMESNSSYDTPGSHHLTYQDNLTCFIMCLKLWNDTWCKTHIPLNNDRVLRICCEC